MRSVSSRLVALSALALRAGSILACLTAGLAVLVATPSGPALPQASMVALTAPLEAHGVRRPRTEAWWGGLRTAATGEAVTIFVSDTYPVDDALGQRWADFFAGLVHGAELQQLSVYVAPLAEVQSICGEHALGCYGGGRLVMMGEPVDGVSVTPEEVARHEYGHHVAANRDDSPWQAIDWGPKRWSSYAGICARAAAGTAFPGDEGDHYTENPGEAFAEAYRLLNDTKAGVTSSGWSVVDSSFYPDAGALSAVEQDVLQPWQPPATETVGGRFARGGKRTWKLALVTPLDGSLSVVLTVPAGALDDLTLLAAGGRTVLASSLWSGATEKTLTFSLCGQRSVRVRVTRRGVPTRFSLRITKP